MAMVNGMHIVKLPANQAWAVCWFDQVLKICNSRAEALQWFDDWSR